MPGFTGSRIDRADALRKDADQAQALSHRPEARLLQLNGLEPLLDGAGRLTWSKVNGSELLFLGLEGEAPLFAPLAPTAPEQHAFNLFGLMDRMAGADAALWGIARSLNLWHARHGFCANCGAATRVERAGWMRRCGGCGAEHFPRVDPVVIMLAEYDDKVLVGRGPHYPPGRYSALAGFVEPGESIEEAVARELKEEAGIEIRVVRYVTSQPWPFPSQLMIACIAEASGDALTLDESEIEHAFWVDRVGVAAALEGRDAAPFKPPPHYAIAHDLLSHWLGE